MIIIFALRRGFECAAGKLTLDVPKKTHNGNERSVYFLDVLVDILAGFRRRGRQEFLDIIRVDQVRFEALEKAAFKRQQMFRALDGIAWVYGVVIKFGLIRKRAQVYPPELAAGAL